MADPELTPSVRVGAGPNVMTAEKDYDEDYDGDPSRSQQICWGVSVTLTDWRASLR